MLMNLMMSLLKHKNKLILGVIIDAVSVALIAVMYKALASALDSIASGMTLEPSVVLSEAGAAQQYELAKQFYAYSTVYITLFAICAAIVYITCRALVWTLAGKPSVSGFIRALAVAVPLEGTFIFVIWKILGFSAGYAWMLTLFAFALAIVLKFHLSVIVYSWAVNKIDDKPDKSHSIKSYSTKSSSSMNYSSYSFLSFAFPSKLLMLYLWLALALVCWLTLDWLLVKAHDTALRTAVSTALFLLIVSSARILCMDAVKS